MSEESALLEKIRDQYYDIQLITMHCCSDISPEAITDMIRQRNELIDLISDEEKLLISNETRASEATSSRKVREEIKAIIEKIIILDKQVENVIKNHMKKLEAELLALYRTSRAASAYAIQSRV